MFVKYIQAETGTRVQIKGMGSGFIENDTGREAEEPMHVYIRSVLGFLFLDLSFPRVGKT